MSNKSHVGMGHKLCLVTGEKYDEVVLLDKQLKDTLTTDMFMGYGISPQALETLEDRKYIFIIETDQNPNTSDEGFNVTGVAAITRHFANKLFDLSMDFEGDFVFVAQGVIQAIQENANEPSTEAD